MILRHLVTQFLQHQAKAKFAEAMSGGAAPKQTPTPHAAPQFVDGLVLYPSELDAGGVLDVVKEKQTTHCESFIEQHGALGTRQVVLIETGDGPQAGAITSAALQWVRPLWILSCGFASGLKSDVRRGEIVMASRIVNESGDGQRVGLALAAGQSPPAGIHWGDLLTVSRLPRSLQEKQALAARGAVAWDADSYYVAMADTTNLTFVSVRMITEAINDELPKALKVYREQKTLAGKLGAATGALFDDPAALQKMWKLRDDALKLSDRLAQFLLGVVEQLPRRDPRPSKSAT